MIGFVGISVLFKKTPSWRHSNELHRDGPLGGSFATLGINLGQLLHKAGHTVDLWTEDDTVKHQRKANGKQKLTAREKEVLASVATGKSDKEIAAALRISAATVRFHLTNLYAKRNVKSRAELLAQLLQEGRDC